MAKNITIKKKGVSTDFADVERIKTYNKNDEETLWMPEDETTLTDLFVTDNGTYVAEGDGYYGYRQVEVHASGSLIGRSTEDNNEYYVYEDGNGNLVYEPLPSSIVIDTEPTKMDYEDGELIDLAGAVIKAYKGDGTLWTHEDYPDGIIPLSEIDYEPKYADKDSTDGIIGTKSGVMCKLVPLIYDTRYYGTEVSASEEKNYGKVDAQTLWEIAAPRKYDAVYLTQWENYLYWIVNHGQTGLVLYFDTYSGWHGTPEKYNWYFYETESLDTVFPKSKIKPSSVTFEDMQPIGQEITLKWNRVVDNKQLASYLYINVTEQE